MNDKKTVFMWLRKKPYEEIITYQQFQTILRLNQRVVVDFYADWCGPCRMISPTYLELASDYKQIKCLKVNVDKAQEVAQRCGVRSMPTFHFYRNGVKVKEIVGANKAALQYEFAHL